MVLDLWGDPKTRLPIRVEMTVPTPAAPSPKVTMTDFVFNGEIGESLFSLEPPAGYTAVRKDEAPPNVPKK